MANNDDDIAPPKKKSKAKWIILLILLLILGGAAGAAWYFIFSDGKGLSSGPSEGQPTAQQTPGGDPKATGIYASLPPFLVNLSDPLGKRFIRLSVDVEVANPAVVEELTKQNARIRDSINLLLGSKTYADLSPMEGKLRLKNEILDRLNQILGGPKVTRVFLTDIVIQ